MEKTVEELRSLLAKATERPWIVDADMTPAKERVYFVKKERAKAVVAFVGNERYPFSEPDAQLIAAAVNALPALLDRLAFLERVLHQATLDMWISDNGEFIEMQVGDDTEPDCIGPFVYEQTDVFQDLATWLKTRGEEPGKAAAGAGDSGAGVVEK